MKKVLIKIASVVPVFALAPTVAFAAGSSSKAARGLTGEWVAISLCVGIGIAALVAFIIYRVYKKPYIPVPYDYKKEAKLDLTGQADNFVTKRTESRQIQTNTNDQGN
ncbi:MAG: hypothetical protein WCP73_00790 [Eubacteriales bacterium]